MLLQPSDKLLLAHRRLFEGDVPRYFVGEVVAYEDGIVKVHGFTFVHDAMSGEYLRKEDARTKIVSLTSSAFLVYELPRAADVASVRFFMEGKQITLDDGRGFVMNMAEAPSLGSI